MREYDLMHVPKHGSDVVRVRGRREVEVALARAPRLRHDEALRRRRRLHATSASAGYDLL